MTLAAASASLRIRFGTLLTMNSSLLIAVGMSPAARAASASASVSPNDAVAPVEMRLSPESRRAGARMSPVDVVNVAGRGSDPARVLVT
jgi:hypothetical protein